MNLEFIRKAEDTDDPRIVEDFNEWLKDDSYVKDYDDLEFFREELLIRVYKYVPKESEDLPLFDEAGDPLGALEERVIPLARVIKTGKEVRYFKAGDIIVLTDSISESGKNPAFLDYKEKEHVRPDNRGKMPKVMIHGVEKFSPMRFIKDKLLGFQDEDELTFLIPESLARCKKNF